jgi:P27 family predicted phage terminase small subunit
MSRRGPQRTPTKTLERRGSWLAKMRTGEPELSRKMPPCPDWLDADAHAEWERVVVELEAMGIVGATDYAVLTGYCQSWSQFKQASEMLAIDGSLHKPRTDGEVRRNPITFILKDSRESMLRFARELGLSPSSRAGVSAIAGGGDEDPLAKLLRKRGALN